MLALALFRLKPGRTVDEYRAYSERFIHPGMNAMPSVVRFRDLAITGTMDGSTGGWDLVELIDITSAEDFERDHAGPPGKDVADDWATWVEEYTVLWCDPLVEASRL
jgi:hypothetical protein